MIKALCPKCGNSKIVPDHFVGQKVICKPCGSKFEIEAEDKGGFVKTQTVLMPDNRSKMLARIWFTLCLILGGVCVSLAARAPQIIREYGPPAKLDTQTGEKIPSHEQVKQAVFDEIQSGMVAPKTTEFTDVFCTPVADTMRKGVYQWGLFGKVSSQNRLGVPLTSPFLATVTFDPANRATKIEHLSLNHETIRQTQEHREYAAAQEAASKKANQ